MTAARSRSGSWCVPLVLLLCAGPSLADEAGPPLPTEPTTLFWGIEGNELASRQAFEWLRLTRRDAQKLRRAPGSAGTSCEGPGCALAIETDPACSSVRGTVVGGQWDKVIVGTGTEMIRVRAWKANLPFDPERVFVEDKVCESPDPAERQQCMARHVARAPDLTRGLVHGDLFTAPDCNKDPRPAYCEPGFSPVQKQVLSPEPMRERANAQPPPRVDRKWMWTAVGGASMTGALAVVAGGLGAVDGAKPMGDNPTAVAALALAGTTLILLGTIPALEYHSRPHKQRVELAMQNTTPRCSWLP